MNILLDECVPNRLKKYLVGYAVKTVPVVLKSVILNLKLTSNLGV
jgi:predicted nuclease of predicted toxin-antitoxin system